MKCFYHHGVEAVALCKACQRALCPECAADVHPGTACRNRCEQEVAAINAMMERGKSAYQKTGAAYRRSAFALALTGLVFLAMGIVPFALTGKYSSLVFALVGPVFFLWSYFSYRSGKQIEAAEANA